MVFAKINSSSNDRGHNDDDRSDGRRLTPDAVL